MMLNYRPFLLSLLLPLVAHGQAEVSEAEPIEKVSLADLASRSDLVALVQVADTDYQYTREFPSGGLAFLSVLIPYKVSRPLEDLLEVYEEGLHDFECYFPTPEIGKEGRRYLVFLKFSEDVKEQYNGPKPGCALEVLVTSDNRYALKFPLEGISLSESYEEFAREFQFADAYAVVDEEGISPDRRNRMLDEGWLAKDGERYRYTHGIDLATARSLLGPETLTLDRALK